MRKKRTCQLIASLAEIDRRRLYLPQGFSSLFTFCTQKLYLAEGAAYRRIEAARASRRFPILLERLEDGSLTLATLGLLVPHLTADNHARVLELARHKSKRDVEMLAASLRPLPAVPSVVRRLPEVKSSILRNQDLMRHTNPSGDPAIIVERALALLHADVLRKKVGITKRPRTRLATNPEPMRDAPESTAAEF